MSEIETGVRTRKPAVSLRRRPALIRAGALVCAGALLCQGAIVRDALAGPKGGTVVAGQGDISRPDAATTVVKQRSKALAVNWKTFDVKAGELVRFNQPSASATVLNRVVNQSPSQIFGSVRANGQVFILNAGGVVIGPGARVNVGGLFLSSLDISTDDFMAGNYRFQARAGETPGAIVNRGLIEAARGGSVSLVGGQVSNEGVIVADVGHVMLAAGRTATVDFDGDGLIRFEVDGDILDNPAGAQEAVSNSGTLQAEGGRVLLSARTAGQVFERAVNNSGLIRAGSIRKTGGKVLLTGFGAGVRNTGTVDASGTAGGEVRLTSDAAIDQLGSITARGDKGDGGQVRLASLGTTTAGDGSVTSARSEQGKGGTVAMLGSQVVMQGAARIDVSGDTGGGTALVGGDYRGGGGVATAARTIMSEHAAIDARARTDGDGGKVVVWADDVAEVRGSGNIDARGGRVRGDGGFVETSGKRRLVLGAAVDASAANGKGGTWLLDPIDVTIQNLSGDSVPPMGGIVDMLTSIDAATLVDALESGFDVEIRTDGRDDGSVGNITVVNGLDAINIMMGKSATLTLTADNDILVPASSGGIQSPGGTLDLVLSADADGNEGGVPVNGQTGGNVIVDDTISLPMGTLTVAGVDVSLGTVTASTVNVQNVTGTAAVGGVLTADALNVAASTRNAAFTGDGSSVIGPVSFLNTGTLTLGQAAGTQTYTGGVTTDSVFGKVTLNGVIQTGGAAISLGAVELGSAVSLMTSGAGVGDISVAGALDTATGAGSPAALTLDAGADDITFAGAVGALSPLGAVTVNAAGDVDIGSSFSAAGFTQTAGAGITSIGGQMDLGGNLDLNSGAVRIAADVATTGTQGYGAAVVLGANVTLTTGSGARFDDAVDGDFSLVVNTSGSGITRFSGAVGAVTPLAQLVTNADGSTMLDAGAVNTSGSQRYDGAVMLGDNTALTASRVSFGGAVDGSGNALLVDANADFDGVVSALSGLVVSGTSTIATDIAVAGTQSFTGAVTLGGGDPTLTGATVDLQGAVDGGGNDLTVNGVAVVNGAVTAVADLHVTGAAKLGADVTTSGRQDYDGAVTLLGGARVLESVGDAPMTFGSTLDGAFDLIINTGASTTFVQAVGGLTPLVSLATDAGGAAVIAGGAVTTSGAQTFNDAVSVTAPATLAGSALQLPATGSISTAGNALTLTFDAVALDTTVSAGGGIVTIDTRTGRDVNLGTETAGELSLTAAEIAGIAAGTLRIGAAGGFPNNAGITVSAAINTAGTISLFSGGDINGGGGITAGDLALAAGGGIGIGATVTAATTGTLDLSTNAPGAAGNIRFTDTTPGGLAASSITGLSTDAGTQQNIRLTTSNGFDYDSNAVAAGLTGDTLVVGGNTTLRTDLAVPAGSTITLQGTTAVAAGGGATSGAGTLAFDGNVNGNGNDLDVGTRVSEFTGNITMGAGDTLSLGSSVTRFTGSTNLIADNLVLGGGFGSVDGPGDLTVLRASPATGDTIIGGADSQFSTANVAALSGFDGTLGIGGTRTTPPTPSQLLNNITVSEALNTVGAVSLVSGGDINGGGGITAGDLALAAGGGIGIGATVTAATTGTLDLSTNAPGAAGNIRFTDTTPGGLAASSITGLSTDAGTQQNIRLTTSNGFDYDSNAVAAGLTGDTLVVGGNTTLRTDLAVPAGSTITLQGTTAVAAGGGATSGAGTLAFDGNVNGNGNDLDVGTRVSEFTGNITMGAGDTLSLGSSVTRFTGSTNLIADNLVLGGGFGSVDGPGDLTVLRASPATGDTIIGGTDSQFSTANVAALSGFDGTLGIGGTRTTPPTPSQLLNNITVSEALNTAGDVFVAGAGDVTFISGPGKITSPGTVTVLALGDAVTSSSGNIFDTNASLVADPVIQANLIELAAAQQIGSELSSQGALLNVTGNTLSPIQGVEGDVQVRNTTFPEATSDSVLPVVDVYALAGGPGGPLEGLINPAFVNLAGAGVSPVVTPSAPTVREEDDDLTFIDEGIFLLPPAFTSPERALLLPVLGDPDFPADRRPEDPSDDAAWLEFFEGVVLEFILSRHPLSEDASATERTAAEAVVAAELAVVIAYYDAVRERERGMLASQAERAKERAVPGGAGPSNGKPG